jgi:hypothetical protein
VRAKFDIFMAAFTALMALKCDYSSVAWATFLGAFLLVGGHAPILKK